MPLPNQRWFIHPQNAELANLFAAKLHISPIVGQLLVNRGITSLEDAGMFLNPESLPLPSPLEEFTDLAVSVELLKNAIATQTEIRICGDYDADGMTSTALLMRGLRWLGARVNYAIPSRMHEGYGINRRIVEEFHGEGVGVIVTVDNGISAYEPIARARELGLDVIITDHHDIPQQLPPANAILNPKLLPEDSLYRGVAGVGVAYILAVTLAQQLEQVNGGILKPMLELFTLGTIADLAPLTGVNRRWLKRGLRQLPKSQIPGIQALIQISGVQAREQGSMGAEEQRSRGENQNNSSPSLPLSPSPTPAVSPPSKSLRPDDIGFKLGPRINAVGRIGNPQVVIELLTTDDMGIALEQAMQCEGINRDRQMMCEQIEQEAIALVEDKYVDSLRDDRVLLVLKSGWHHGVIGIVASRLVERYGVPVFIATNEEDGQIRGSARSIPEFNVFNALEYCHDLLGKYGGHRAAGGFSLPGENLEKLRSRLSEFANQCLKIEHLKPLVKIDAQADINQIDQNLYQQLSLLEPCGIDNPNPVFWTPQVRVVEQQIVGKGHIKMTLAQRTHDIDYRIKAIAWRSRDYFPLPGRVDIAYKLRENEFNGKVSLEMEIVGFRTSTSSEAIQVATPSVSCANPSNLPSQQSSMSFEFNGRQYLCGLYKTDAKEELRIKNTDGNVLAVQLEYQTGLEQQTELAGTGLLGTNRETAKPVDISQPHLQNLIQAALSKLGKAKT